MHPVNKNTHALCFLHGRQRKDLCKVLDTLDKDEIDCLCEIALNIHNGRIALTDAQHRKLWPHRKLFQELAKKKGHTPAKKKKILQRGRGFLIPLILSLAGPLFGKLVS